MWIVGVILGVAAFLSFLLLVPVHLVFSSERGAESTQTKVTVKWLFGLIRFTMPPKGREREKPKKERRRPRIFFIALRTYGFAQRIVTFVKDLLRVVHVRWLRVNVRLGLLPDPADTGMLAGAIIPVMALASPSHGIELNVEPDFCLEGLAAQIDGELKVYPIALIMPVARLVLSVPTFRVVKAAVLER